MSIADPLIVETADRIFESQCPPETVDAAEEGTWPGELWRTIAEAGLDRTWVPDSLGGAGATLADGFAVARAAGRHAAPLPLGDTLAAAWLLAAADLEAPAGPLALASSYAGDGARIDGAGRLTGTALRVPFARHAGYLVVCPTGGSGPELAVVERAACTIAPGASLAGEALDDVGLDGAQAMARAAVPPGLGERPAASIGAAVRAQQMAGALARVLEISLQYAQDRSQFGRPISKFQAVQHNLARLAGEVAAAGVAADGAAGAIERFGLADHRGRFAVAAAKIRAGEAAGEGAAIGHQVHGAIGFTHEYRLHHFTRRLWAWRDDFDPEAVWAIRLGEQVSAAGADALWPTLTDL